MGHEDKTARGRVLIVTAVEAERDAVLRGLGGDERFHVVAAGAGPAAAAAGTAFALAAAGQALMSACGESAPAEKGPAEELLGSADFSGLEAAGLASTAAPEAGSPAEELLGSADFSGLEAAGLASTAADNNSNSVTDNTAAAGSDNGSITDNHAAAGGTNAALAAPAAPSTAQAGGYALVISAGIAGGFPGLAAVGSLVVASEIIAADLGAETPDGFVSVDELGFGSSRIGVDARLAGALAAAVSAAGLPVSTGPVLTVTTATGTAATAAEHERRVPGAAAEAMEGFGVASAAKQFFLPALELRAVSNAVGPRDRSAWRIGEALQALERASQILREVL